MRQPIDVKLMLYAAIAVFVVHSVWLYLMSQVVIFPLFDPSVSAEPAPENIWALRLWKYLALASFSLGFVLIFARGYEGKPGVGEGFRYALLVGILVVLPAFFFNLCLTPPRPTGAIVARFVVEFFGIFIIGALANMIYRPRQSKTGT